MGLPRCGGGAGVRLGGESEGEAGFAFIGVGDAVGAANRIVELRTNCFGRTGGCRRSRGERSAGGGDRDWGCLAADIKDTAGGEEDNSTDES